MSHLVLPLALSALQPQDQLLGGLGLLPQDGLGLTSESLLLAVVPEQIDIRINNVVLASNNLPTTTLGLLGLGGLLVLGHLEWLVGQALGVGAVRPAELGHVHHDGLTEYLRINSFSLLIPMKVKRGVSIYRVRLHRINRDHLHLVIRTGPTNSTRSRARERLSSVVQQ